MPALNILTNKLPEPNVVNSTCSIDIATHHTITPDRELVIRVIRRILDDHQVQQGEISIAIVDDPTLRALNRDYLDHDYETDVLSFVLDRDPDSGLLQGEVIVSADMAAREAEGRNVSVEAELMLYMIHGTLHLVGLDDGDDDARRQMRAAERRYTSAFGIEYASHDEEPTTIQTAECGGSHEKEAGR